MTARAPTSSWQRFADADRKPASPQGRVVGAVIGCGVSLAFVVAASWWAIFSGIFDFNGSGLATGLALAAAVVLAGLTGGAIAGPHAWRARTPGAWARVIGGLPLLAILVGAVVIGEAIAVAGMVEPGPPYFWKLIAPLVGLLYAGLGMAIYGIFVLPVTLAASIVWAIAMRVALAWHRRTAR